MSRDNEAQKSKLIDIAATIKIDRPKAWLLTDGVREAWVPKSQAEDNGDGTFAMPEWLAVEKRFL